MSFIGNLSFVNANVNLTNPLGVYIDHTSLVITGSAISITGSMVLNNGSSLVLGGDSSLNIKGIVRYSFNSRDCSFKARVGWSSWLGFELGFGFGLRLWFGLGLRGLGLGEGLAKGPGKVYGWFPGFGRVQY